MCDKTELWDFTDKQYEFLNGRFSTNKFLGEGKNSILDSILKMFKVSFQYLMENELL